MKFLIIADPIAALKPKGDTGLSMLRESLKRKHKTYWATGEDLELDNGNLFVNAQRATKCAPGVLPELSDESERLLIRDFDSVWIRKDPPFDASYVSLCWLLALEETRVLIVNRPSSLLRYHEKLLPLEAYNQGFIDAAHLVPTYLATGEKHWNVPSSFNRQIVAKPWLGFGGNSIERWDSLAEYSRSVEREQRANSLVQPFLENIAECGDRRVLFIDGEYVADVLRLPQEGSFVSNLAQGGRAELRALTPDEEKLIGRIGPFLKKVGIFNAGVDLVDGHLTEINITAPTTYETVATLTGVNPAIRYLDVVEEKVRKQLFS